jgi:hypothetical protein
MAPTTIGTVVKFSLRTCNRETAEAREAVARFELSKIFNAAQKGPAPISQRQRAALAGRVYELFADAFGENPGTPDKWAAWKAFNRAAGEGRITSAAAISTEPFDEIQAAKDRFGDNLTAGINSLPCTETFEGLEARFGAAANWVLARHDLEIDADTRKALLIDIYRAAQAVGFRLKRNAGGDYRPDPEQEKFPTFEKAPQITLSDLFERWRAEGRPAPSTVSTWRGAIKLFKLHLGHQNARAITTEDVIAFKDALVAKGRTAKTINDSTLTALRAIFNFAVRNKLLSSGSGEPATPIRGRGGRSIVAARGKAN